MKDQLQEQYNLYRYQQYVKLTEKLINSNYIDFQYMKEFYTEDKKVYNEFLKKNMMQSLRDITNNCISFEN